MLRASFGLRSMPVARARAVALIFWRKAIKSVSGYERLAMDRRRVVSCLYGQT